jgi:hypothetical protein
LLGRHGCLFRLLQRKAARLRAGTVGPSAERNRDGEAGRSAGPAGAVTCKPPDQEPPEHTLPIRIGNSDDALQNFCWELVDDDVLD